MTVLVRLAGIERFYQQNHESFKDGLLNINSFRHKFVSSKGSTGVERSRYFVCP